jgi:hypothetical protein
MAFSRQHNGDISAMSETILKGEHVDQSIIAEIAVRKLEGTRVRFCLHQAGDNCGLDAVDALARMDEPGDEVALSDALRSIVSKVRTITSSCQSASDHPRLSDVFYPFELPELAEDIARALRYNPSPPSGSQELMMTIAKANELQQILGDGVDAGTVGPHHLCPTQMAFTSTASELLRDMQSGGMVQSSAGSGAFSG